MNSILFIRHAATDLAGTFCGHSDPPVNREGQCQILQLVAALRAESIEAVYTSDLRRAVTTAQAVADAFAAPMTAAPGLREIYFGEWEGFTWREVEERDPSYAQRWIASYPDVPAPGGEAFADFESRCLAHIRPLLADSRRIAVVTHGGVLRVALRSLCGLSEQAAWDRTQGYCCRFRAPNGISI